MKRSHASGEMLRTTPPRSVVSRTRMRPAHVGRLNAAAAVGAGVARLAPRGAVYGFHFSAISSIRVRDSLRRYASAFSASNRVLA